MGDSLRLLLRYAGISLRGQMQYRASFWMLATAHFVNTGIEFAGLWVLFQRFGSLQGWRLEEVALLYGIVNCAFALAEGVGRGWDVFPGLVRSGGFDRLLLRPRGTALQVAGAEMQLMRVGRLAQAALVLTWALGKLELWTRPELLLLTLFCILGGACLFYGLFVLTATAAFWTVEGLEVANCVTYGGTETAQYPMSIYPRWFRGIFTFLVPLACIGFLPAQVLLGRTEGWGTLPLWLAPCVGVLFLVVSLWVWEFGVKRYHSTGS